MAVKSDSDWLLYRMPYAEFAQIEAFSEKVSILVDDRGMDEETAREDAFKLIFWG